MVFCYGTLNKLRQYSRKLSTFTREPRLINPQILNILTLWNLLAKDILPSTFNREDLFLLASVMCLLTWKSSRSKNILCFFVFSFPKGQYLYSCSCRGKEGIVGRLLPQFPPNLMRTGTLCILFTSVYPALYRARITQSYSQLRAIERMSEVMMHINYWVKL